MKLLFSEIGQKQHRNMVSERNKTSNMSGRLPELSAQRKLLNLQSRNGLPDRSVLAELRAADTAEICETGS